MEIWFKLWCPKCNAVNWLCDGEWNIIDDSKTDIEACKCNNCSYCWWLYDEEDRDPWHDDEDHDPKNWANLGRMHAE